MFPLQGLYSRFKSFYKGLHNLYDLGTISDGSRDGSESDTVRCVEFKAAVEIGGTPKGNTHTNPFKGTLYSVLNPFKQNLMENATCFGKV